MATFKFTGTITVEGKYIKTQKDAKIALQVMLEDFDSNNPDEDTSVCIHWDKVEKITEVRD